MKKKIIVTLSALMVLAFPMSSLAVNNSYSHNYTCSVEGCQIDGTHEHYGNGNHNSGSHHNSGNTSNSGRHHR